MNQMETIDIKQMTDEQLHAKLQRGYEGCKADNAKNATDVLHQRFVKKSANSIVK